MPLYDTPITLKLRTVAPRTEGQITTYGTVTEYRVWANVREGGLYQSQTVEDTGVPVEGQFSQFRSFIVRWIPDLAKPAIVLRGGGSQFAEAEGVAGNAYNSQVVDENGVTWDLVGVDIETDRRRREVRLNCERSYQVIGQTEG